MIEQEKPSSPLLTYLSLAAGVICIGTSAIFVKSANLPGIVSAFYRVFIASIILVPWRLAKQSRIPAWKDMRLIALGGIFFALDLVLWNSGLLLTSAATATLLANNAPLWVGLGALLLFHEQLPGKYWLGLTLSITGMAVIIGSDAWRELRWNSGDMLAIGASVFYAAYLLTTQKARIHVDTLTFNALSMTTAVILLFPLNLIAGAALYGFEAKTWLALLGLGLVSQLGGWLAINYALGHLRAAHVSVSLLGQVVVTAILGMLILSEAVGMNQVVGGGLVLSGIYLVNQRKT